MTTLRVGLAVLGLGLLTPVFAQPFAPPTESAPASAEPSTAREDLRDNSGTTIVGERESPIGLYITPWRNAAPEQDIDRPARLLQVDMAPVDRDVFERQVEYHQALSEARRSQQAPAAAPPAP